jgi:hypothetical protein
MEAIMTMDWISRSQFFRFTVLMEAPKRTLRESFSLKLGLAWFHAITTARIPGCGL